MATSMCVCLTLKTTRFLNENKIKFVGILKKFVFSTSFPKEVAHLTTNFNKIKFFIYEF